MRTHHARGACNDASAHKAHRLSPATWRVRAGSFALGRAADAPQARLPRPDLPKIAANACESGNGDGSRTLAQEKLAISGQRSVNGVDRICASLVGGATYPNWARNRSKSTDPRLNADFRSWDTAFPKYCQLTYREPPGAIMKLGSFAQGVRPKARRQEPRHAWPHLSSSATARSYP